MALEKSCITRERSTVWAAWGISDATPSECASAMSLVTSSTRERSPPRSSSWSQSLPTDPLSLPSVTATTRRASRSTMVLM